MDRIIGILDASLAIRLVVAALIFAVAVILQMPGLLRIVLLILAVILAGYDVFLSAINSVEGGDYFAAPLIVVFVTAISFVVGYAAEGAAMILLYQLGSIAMDYAVKRSKRSALDLVRGQDEAVVARIKEVMEARGAGDTVLERSVKHSAGLILKLALVVAVLYAILVPLLTALPFKVSIHRALMIALVAAPGSVVASMPLAALMGLGCAAGKGIVFNNAAIMEKAAAVDTVVFDKAGVFAENCPRVLHVQSDVLDRETFMNFIAHAVYYSDQPLAKAVSAIYEQDYRLELVSDFHEIPGSGVAVNIGGSPVIVATGEFMASRGVSVPVDPSDVGQAFYMTIAGRYIGKILVSSAVNQQTAGLAENMREAGVKRSVLLTEDGLEESQRFAQELNIQEVHGEFVDAEGKLDYVRKLAEGQKNKLMYVYANGIEAHSAAAVDVRVSKKTKYADAMVLPDCVSQLPAAIRVGRRVEQVSAQNAIFSFVIKAILIFLSMLGLCTIWFVAMLDIVAAIFTVLASVRVTSPPRVRGSEMDDEDEFDED